MQQRTTGRLSSSQPEPIVIASPMWSAKIRVHDVASSLQRVSLDLSPAGKSENAMTALEDAMASTSPRFSVNDCDLEVSPPRTNLISPFFKIQQQDQKHQRFEKRNAEVDEDEPFLLSRRRSSVASLPPFSPPGMHSMFMFNDMDGLQSDGRVCTKLDIPQQDSGDISMIIEAEAMHASQAPVYSSVDVPPRPPWSTDWSHPGKSFRMFNRAQSHHGYDYEAPPEECMQDWQGSENSSIPHTPHSPDPELLISNAPWGGDCPPTPAQQRC